MLAKNGELVPNNYYKLGENNFEISDGFHNYFRHFFCLSIALPVLNPEHTDDKVKSLHSLMDVQMAIINDENRRQKS